MFSVLKTISEVGRIVWEMSTYFFAFLKLCMAYTKDHLNYICCFFYFQRQMADAVYLKASSTANKCFLLGKCWCADSFCSQWLTGQFKAEFLLCSQQRHILHTANMKMCYTVEKTTQGTVEKTTQGTKATFMHLLCLRFYPNVRSKVQVIMAGLPEPRFELRCTAYCTP